MYKSFAKTMKWALNKKMQISAGICGQQDLLGMKYKSSILRTTCIAVVVVMPAEDSFTTFENFFHSNNITTHVVLSKV